jgi:cysteine sulfinate desulfinase/cysteine desulfurase-like protein
MKLHDEPTGAYFDCNATTPTMPAASAAAMMAMGKLYGNPSSVHLAGLQAKAIL